MENNILIGKSDSRQIRLLGKYGNRHGLIAGATGTGKTVTLMTIAEGFSRMGTPVFVADVKGDMAGLSMAGKSNPKIVARAESIGIDDFAFGANPVSLWDLWGQNGHPVRTSIQDVGSTLLARMLELNDTQEGVLEIAFYYAKEHKIDIITLKDMRSIMVTMNESRESITAEYGLVSSGSIGAIQRSLLRLETDGIDNFFGEPGLALEDFIQCENGKGIINILAAESLILKPRLYSTFLLWMLTELFRKMPEVGDLDKPKMVFFFDEAHLLFDDCAPDLLRRIEQVVRLIRSKGVGIYFCSQNPDDIPESVLGQLGNRVQHALRAFTPRDQKAVRAAAETFATNPSIDVRETIQNLGVGEALVSMLDSRGIPESVERVIIAPPRCRLGTITVTERKKLLRTSVIGSKYDIKPERKLTPQEVKARLYRKVDKPKEPVVELALENEVEPVSFWREFYKALFPWTIRAPSND